ncbi:undecaprenyl-diphosphate phosphatase [Candidatus Parcubacteria bacterium]|nr:undecaprenyl-diphosphate phosphatase [Candidatus Parcubacteria bacterium]
MSIFHALTLGLIQGVTEFLPISSSGFLVILPELFGWPLQSVTFDAVVHLGTLAAIIHAMRSDIASAWAHQRRTFWWITAATVPVLAAGFVMELVLQVNVRSTSIVAISFVLWGIVLLLADRSAKTVSDTVQTVGWKRSLVIGLAQVIALIPGTSRSGITISAGLFGGLSRQTATTFSFLLGIPTLFVAGMYSLFEAVRNPTTEAFWPLAVGAVTAFLSCLVTVRAVRAWLDRRGTYAGLAVFRLVVGLLLFAWVL